MNDHPSEQHVEQPERRKHANLRPLFDDVIRRVEPFFQGTGGLNGNRPDYWVSRTIRDAYPELTNADVHVLASAAQNYFRERVVQGKATT